MFTSEDDARREAERVVALVHALIYKVAEDLTREFQQELGDEVVAEFDSRPLLRRPEA